MQISVDLILGAMEPRARQRFGEGLRKKELATVVTKLTDPEGCDFECIGDLPG